MPVYNSPFLRRQQVAAQDDLYGPLSMAGMTQGTTPMAAPYTPPQTGGGGTSTPATPTTPTTQTPLPPATSGGHGGSGGGAGNPFPNATADQYAAYHKAQKQAFANQADAMRDYGVGVGPAMFSIFSPSSNFTKAYLGDRQDSTPTGLADGGLASNPLQMASPMASSVLTQTPVQMVPAQSTPAQRFNGPPQSPAWNGFTGYAPTPGPTTQPPLPPAGQPPGNDWQRLRWQGNGNSPFGGGNRQFRDQMDAWRDQRPAFTPGAHPGDWRNSNAFQSWMSARPARPPGDDKMHMRGDAPLTPRGPI